MSQKLTILFDLDGTLVNTAPDLMRAHNYVMKKYGFGERKLSDIKKLAGRGSKVMLTKSMHEVAELSGKIIGYIMCKMEHGFSNFKKLGFVKKGHVVSIAVIDNHRRKGFGSVLVDEAIKGVKIRQCSELYLEVRCSNNDAVRLYEKLGFSIIHRLKAYYRDGEDAYVMAIELTS